MTNSVDILINGSEDELLPDVLNILTKVISILHWEIRDSSFYVEGIYAVITLRGERQMLLAFADSSEFATYRFWLSLEENSKHNKSKRELDEFADHIAQDLAIMGRESLRPKDLNRVGQGHQVFLASF